MLAGSVIVFFAILFFCLGCTSPGSATPVTATPVTYKEIFIDTYDPTDPTGANGAQYPNYMELWSSDGKTRLAYYDGNNDLRPANEFYAYIDYTGGLTSGDYWVLIKESGTGGQIRSATGSGCSRRKAVSTRAGPSGPSPQKARPTCRWLAGEGLPHFSRPCCWTPVTSPHPRTI
jgi:hypothetical protein